MIRLLRVSEGSAAGLLIGAGLVCLASLISSTWLGIGLTLMVCMMVGFFVNGIEGTIAGLITGSITCLLANMASQTLFGIVCTVFLSVLIGGIVGWETSRFGCPCRT